MIDCVHHGQSTKQGNTDSDVLKDWSNLYRFPSHFRVSSSFLVNHLKPVPVTTSIMPLFSRICTLPATSLSSVLLLLVFVSVKPAFSAPVLSVRGTTNASIPAFSPPHFVVYGDQYIEGTQGPPDVSDIEVRSMIDCLRYVFTNDLL